MLSKSNVEKLVMTGLYKHEPDRRYRRSLYWDNMYHCFNWTFKVRHNEEDNKWYMVDTYFGDKYIELTDENFDEFEFLFDFEKVEKHSGENIYEYDESDWWHVAVDSGGMYCGGKYFVRKDAVKNKEKVLKRINEEIQSLKNKIDYNKKLYERVFIESVLSRVKMQKKENEILKKLFISQPMNGKTDEEILNERKIAIEKAKEIVGEDIEVIDTYYTDFTPEAKPLEYLARSIKDLASADIAYFAKGWEEKRGCKIEYECATQYGIKTITSGTNECLWRFYWDCGRQGKVDGIFKATKEEVDAAIGKEVYFGEILGKHSEVYGEIEEGEITLKSDDPLIVMNAIESGYNPLNYLRYECSVCGDTYSTDEWDFENNMCCYCAEEKNNSK